VNFWVAALTALTVLRLLVAATIPLTPDETYYWIWSVNPQAGYFDHPPMVAFWIRAGTSLFGNTPLGVRLLGPLAAAAGSVLLWDAGEHFLPKRNAGLIAAGLFNATIILGVGSIIMTPDTPLVFFWTAALAALGRLLSEKNARWWLAIGAATGAALLSKYTGALLAAGIFTWLATRAEGRTQLRSLWPWAGAALAAALFAPDIWWNATHGWVSFVKQGSRVDGFNLPRSLGFLVELIAGQTGLITPIAGAIAIAGLWRLRKLDEPAAKLLLWLTLLPALIFLEHTITGRVEENWPAIMLPAAFVASAYVAEPVLAKWLRAALGLGFGLTLLVYAQAIAGPFAIPAPQDPAALQLAGWQDWADHIAAYHPAFLTSDEYAVASELAFHTPSAQTVAGFDTRWRYFNLPSANIPIGQAGILVTRRADTPCPNLLGMVYRRRNSAVITQYKICRFAAIPGMVLLPHP
jgi:4-amino-4-deoxy-L-arabinose transferase-like glycosyltransferase